MPAVRRPPWPSQENMELTIKISPDVKALWTRTLEYLENARNKDLQKEVDTLTGTLTQSTTDLQSGIDSSKS